MNNSGPFRSFCDALKEDGEDPINPEDLDKLAKHGIKNFDSLKKNKDQIRKGVLGVGTYTKEKLLLLIDFLLDLPGKTDIILNDFASYKSAFDNFLFSHQQELPAQINPRFNALQIPQGFFVSQSTGHSNEEKPAPEKEVLTTQVEFEGQIFKRGFCYSYKDHGNAATIVGIVSFKSSFEANTCDIVHVSETFLGQTIDGDDETNAFAEHFVDAASEAFGGLYVCCSYKIVRPLSHFGKPSSNPATIPSFVYEPQTQNQKQSFGYVLRDDCFSCVGSRDEPLNNVELFCGSGGMHQGYKKNQFHLRKAVDNNADACKTFRHNNPEDREAVECADINKCYGQLEDLGRKHKIHLFHASPPCQGFSGANRGGKDDEENKTLSFAFTKGLQKTNALVGVFENVEGMWREENILDLKWILLDLVRIKYQFRVMVLRACDYGVPQNRPRLFILASKHFIPCPERPVPVRTPQVKAGHVLEVFMGEWMRYPNTEDGDIRGTKLQHSEHGCIKLDKEGLAPAIRACGPPILHYSLPRCISVREAAAIMGFSNFYEFIGSLTSKFRQVGNAVPIGLADAVARSTSESLRFMYQQEMQKIHSLGETESLGLTSNLDDSDDSDETDESEKVYCTAILKEIEDDESDCEDSTLQVDDKHFEMNAKRGIRKMKYIADKLTASTYSKLLACICDVDDVSKSKDLHGNWLFKKGSIHRIIRAPPFEEDAEDEEAISTNQQFHQLVKRSYFTTTSAVTGHLCDLISIFDCLVSTSPLWLSREDLARNVGSAFEFQRSVIVSAPFETRRTFGRGEGRQVCALDRHGLSLRPAICSGGGE